MIGRVALAAAIVAAAAPAWAETPAASSATASVAAPPASPKGLALGVELGEPTSLTVGWWMGKLGLSAAFGTGTREGLGFSTHVDAQLEVARPSPHLALRVGLGGRFYHHGYTAMSFDEIPDSHYGVRASVSLAYELDALHLYAELAPGVDVHRSASCTLASGPYSICPHAQERPLFVQLVIGARWFLSSH